jgi:hypothetical protein
VERLSTRRMAKRSVSIAACRSSCRSGRRRASPSPASPARCRCRWRVPAAIARRSPCGARRRPSSLISRLWFLVPKRELGLTGAQKIRSRTFKKTFCSPGLLFKDQEATDSRSDSSAVLPMRVRPYRSSEDQESHFSRTTFCSPELLFKDQDATDFAAGAFQRRGGLRSADEAERDGHLLAHDGVRIVEPRGDGRRLRPAQVDQVGQRIVRGAGASTSAIAAVNSRSCFKSALHPRPSIASFVARRLHTYFLPCSTRRRTAFAAAIPVDTTKRLEPGTK